MPQRNERVRQGETDFDAAPDALNRFFLPSIEPVPAAPRKDDNESDRLQSPGRGTTADIAPERLERVAGPAALDRTPSPDTVIADRMTAVARSTSPSERGKTSTRVAEKPRAMPRTTSRHAQKTTGWRRMAIAALVLIGAAEVILVGWRLMSRPPGLGFGSVTVTSKPAGAQLLVDGDPVGATPTTMQIAEGVHALEVRSGGPTQVMAVRLDNGGQVSRFFDLPVGTAPASLRIDSKPSGARVLVDGRPRGRSPIVVTGLNPGPHAVRLERGPQFLARDVMLESGAEASVSLEIEPLGDAVPAGYGWLAVSMPISLQAYENGRLVGTSRTGPWQMAEGRHEIEFINQLLDVRMKQTVSVVAGRTATVDRPAPSGLVSIAASAPAEIQIDGESIGIAPIVNRSLVAGQHDVVAKHAELGERRFTVTISAGTSVSVRIDFRR
jgi:hypothetical protein